MKHLVQGAEKTEKIDLLISLTSLDSEDMRSAMVDHFCRNMKRSDSALINNVKEPNLSRDIKKINEVAGKLERLKEMDWVKYKEYKNKAALYDAALLKGVIC